MMIVSVVGFFLRSSFIVVLLLRLVGMVRLRMMRLNFFCFVFVLW